MLPYYIIDQNAPMPQAFAYVGWNWARYIVAIGAICSLSTSLLGAMFPLPRVLYAISSDGLIFKFLSYIHPKLKTPVIGTVISGFFAAFMAMIFDLDELVNMMSIGTLLAYSLVAVSVLILRYEEGALKEAHSADRALLRNNNETIISEQTYIQQLIRSNQILPTKQTSKLVKILVGLACINIIILCLILVLGHSSLHQPYIFIPVSIAGSSFCFLGFLIWNQPQNKKAITFQVNNCNFE